jgi:hypothetical protein
VKSISQGSANSGTGSRDDEVEKPMRAAGLLREDGYPGAD